MSYESWRITYQSSEAAARAAWEEMTRLLAENAEMREQMAAIGAGGVEPLRKPAALAGVSAPAAQAGDWKDHHTAQLVSQLRDCATTYGQTQQLRERIATIVAPLCDQLKAHQSVLRPAAPQAPTDTIRLDWLEQLPGGVAIEKVKYITALDSPPVYEVTPWDCDSFDGESLRAAIDAAMAAAKEGTQL